MKFKVDDIFLDENLSNLIQAAKGSPEHMDELGITQKKALERLQDEDLHAYYDVIFYLITTLDGVS